MKIVDKISKIENQIEELTSNLLELKKKQNEIKKKESHIDNLSREISKLNYKDSLDQRRLKEELFNEILDIEWNAKSYLERLESRRYNILYFKKLDYPNFKLENYEFELLIIDYTESLLNIIKPINLIKGIDKRPKLSRIKDWLLKEKYGLLYSRKEVILQDYNDFVNELEVLMQKKVYKDLDCKEKDNINLFLTILKKTRKFKNRKVKFTI